MSMHEQTLQVKGEYEQIGDDTFWIVRLWDGDVVILEILRISAGPYRTSPEIRAATNALVENIIQWFGEQVTRDAGDGSAFAWTKVTP